MANDFQNLVYGLKVLEKHQPSKISSDSMGLIVEDVKVTLAERKDLLAHNWLCMYGEWCYVTPEAPPFLNEDE